MAAPLAEAASQKRCYLATHFIGCRSPLPERWLTGTNYYSVGLMLPSSYCESGSVDFITAGLSSSSALTATAATVIAVTDAGRKAGANSDVTQTAAINKVSKVGLTIETDNDSIGGVTAD